jgi:hypothetical protein
MYIQLETNVIINVRMYFENDQSLHLLGNYACANEKGWVRIEFNQF